MLALHVELHQWTFQCRSLRTNFISRHRLWGHCIGQMAFCLQIFGQHSLVDFSEPTVCPPLPLHTRHIVEFLCKRKWRKWKRPWGMSDSLIIRFLISGHLSTWFGILSMPAAFFCFNLVNCFGELYVRERLIYIFAWTINYPSLVRQNSLLYQTLVIKLALNSFPVDVGQL